jgi:ABC-2 type transport system permease protein
MAFSLTVLAVYFIIFNATSWIVFSKRDVAA